MRGSGSGSNRFPRVTDARDGTSSEDDLQACRRPHIGISLRFPRLGWDCATARAGKDDACIRGRGTGLRLTGGSLTCRELALAALSAAGPTRFPARSARGLSGFHARLADIAQAAGRSAQCGNGAGGPCPERPLFQPAVPFRLSGLVGRSPGGRWSRIRRVQARSLILWAAGPGSGEKRELSAGNAHRWPASGSSPGVCRSGRACLPEP
jgi:hypothetical protein